MIHTSWYQGPDLWINLYAGKIKVILRQICQTSTKHGNIEEFEKTFNKILRIRKVSGANLQPLYDVLNSEDARKAVYRIKKRDKVFPKLLEIFGTAQFLGNQTK